MVADTTLVTPALVSLSVSPPDREACLAHVVSVADEAGRVDDAAAVRDALLVREAESPTGLGSGVAVPHARSPAVRTPTLVVARLANGVDFGAPDGTPATLCLCILVPATASEEHHRILRALSRAVVHDDFRERLRAAATPDAVVEAVREVVT